MSATVTIWMIFILLWFYKSEKKLRKQSINILYFSVNYMKLSLSGCSEWNSSFPNMVKSVLCFFRIYSIVLCATLFKWISNFNKQM